MYWSIGFNIGLILYIGLIIAFFFEKVKLYIVDSFEDTALAETVKVSMNLERDIFTQTFTSFISWVIYLFFISIFLLIFILIYPIALVFLISLTFKYFTKK